MFSLLQELSGAFGVSGSEEAIRSLIMKKVQGKIDEMYTDVMGNLICIKRGKGKKVMLAAHMDEIGIIVTHIDEKGFLRFSNVGWVSPLFAVGQKVIFENGIKGAVYYEEKCEQTKDIKLTNLFIDIGATSKEEAQKKVRIGDAASFWSPLDQQGPFVIGKAMDNRSGCAVLLQTLEEFKKSDKEIYFVFTVQEEVGLRGAKTSAFGLQPDWAIAIDVTLTGDIPNCKPLEVACGKGPAIKIKDNSILCHKEVIQTLKEAAKRAKVPYQLEILEGGGTDAGAIHLTAGGIPTGAISIPCRYTHSPVEMIHLEDMENAVKLLLQALR